MAKIYTYGVTTVKVAAILGDGGMGTSFSAIGETLEDSCKLYHEDATMTEIKVEEQDTPVLSIDSVGSFIVEFTIPDFDTAAMVKVFGGTSTGSPLVYTPPSTFSIVEKSLEIVPRSGLTFKACRVKLVAKLNGTLNKKGVFGIDVKGYILTPTKSGEPAYTFTEPAA